MTIADNTKKSQPELLPDDAAMLAHVEHLFGGFLDGYQDGLIELAWTDTEKGSDGRYALRHGELFGTDQIDALVIKAVALNRIPQCNVYIGPGLRKPGTFPGSRAKDADVLALTAAYADLDDPGTVAAAKGKYGELKPTLVVMTGRHPHPRAQLWWRLLTPVTDQEQTRAVAQGLVQALDGDSQVVNPSRVMRLAGSIAWPMKDDRVVEMTAIVPLKVPGPPAYRAEELIAAFPSPFARFTGEAPQAPPTSAPKPPPRDADAGPEPEFNAWGKRIDHRDQYMSDLVFAAMVGLRVAGATPTPIEMERVWADYERNCAPKHPIAGESNAEGLERDKRGRSAFVKKWADKIKIWDTDIAAAAVERAAREQAPKPEAIAAEAAKAEEAAKTDPNAIYPWLDVPAIKAMTDPLWNIVGLIPQQGVGFVYGPPGSLKSFLMLDLCLAIACGLPDWFGHKIQCAGAVVYISVEGMGHFKFRLMAWEAHRGKNADTAPFVLIKESINFMREADIGKLVATVRAIRDKLTVPITLVVVDTVSRVLPGAKENNQEDMTIFVAACEAVYKEFNCAVAGIHHSNKEGGFRGSSVMPGAGDFLIEVKRESGEMKGSIVARKVKDAPDGWEQFFTVDEITVGRFGMQSSLVVDAVAEESSKPDDWLPPMHTCREILAAIDEQWQLKRPWCFAKNTARWAVTNIATRWHLKPENVDRMLKHWVSQNVISDEVCDAKNHTFGYRKLRDL